MNTVNVFDTEGKPLPSAELLEIARQVAGNRLLLSFSGRDSLAAWLYLRENGFELIPYWCYTVPGLSYDEQRRYYNMRVGGRNVAVRNRTGLRRGAIARGGAARGGGADSR